MCAVPGRSVDSLQVRLLVTYFFVIAVTLGLASLSLLLQLGEYRDSISYGNLEDMGRLVNSQASLQIQLSADSALPGDQPSGSTGDDSGKKLLADLNNYFNNSDSGRLSRETTVAVIDASGRVLPGFATSSTSLDGSVVRDLAVQPPDDACWSIPHLPERIGLPASWNAVVAIVLTSPKPALTYLGFFIQPATVSMAAVIWWRPPIWSGN